MGSVRLMEPVNRYSKPQGKPRKKPVRITSDYGKRTDPNTREKEVQHGGIDYEIEVGTPVRASESGVVVKAGQNGSTISLKLGNVIIIDHTPGAEKNERHLYTVYGHLRNKELGSPFAVKAGDKLEQGQVIGYSGNTGKTTGSHLHSGVAYVSGKQGMPSGDGATWIKTSEYSDPNRYLCQTHKVKGTLTDMVESAIVGRMEFVPDIDFGRNDPFRMGVWLDGKYLGDMKDVRSVIRDINYDFKRELRRMH